MALLDLMNNYTSRITYEQFSARERSEEQEANRIKQWSKEVVQSLKNMNLVEDLISPNFKTSKLGYVHNKQFPNASISENRRRARFSEFQAKEKANLSDARDQVELNPLNVLFDRKKREAPHIFVI